MNHMGRACPKPFSGLKVHGLDLRHETSALQTPFEAATAAAAAVWVGTCRPNLGYVSHLHMHRGRAPLLSHHVLPDCVALKRHLLLLLPPQDGLGLGHAAAAADRRIPAVQQPGNTARTHTEAQASAHEPQQDTKCPALPHPAMPSRSTCTVQGDVERQACSTVLQLTP